VNAPVGSRDPVRKLFFAVQPITVIVTIDDNDVIAKMVSTDELEDKLVYLWQENECLYQVIFSFYQ